MKKTLLSLALIAASSGALATETYNGRLSGMAGAGYVTGGYSDGVLLNPSLIASYGEKDDFALVINGGAFGADEDDLIDGLDDLVDKIDQLENTTNLSEQDADELIALLENVDEKSLGVNLGGSVVVAIPNSFLSAAVIARTGGNVNVLTDVSDEDYETIEAAKGGDFDPEAELTSSVLARGVLVTEVGIALARNFATNDNYQLLIGVTPKRVEVETIVYETTVSEYDEDDLDADDYTVTGESTGLDAGVTYIRGGLRAGLSISNLKSEKFKSIADDETYELARRTTAALGYTGSWYKAEASLDLSPAEGFGQGETKMFRAGVEVSPFSWLQLRGGIQRDMEDTIPDAYTVGLGLSPFGVINLDVAAFSGSDDAVGGAVQLGLRF